MCQASSWGTSHPVMHGGPQTWECLESISPCLPSCRRRPEPTSSHLAQQGMEPGKSVPVELKPSQRARIPAPFFTHLVGCWLCPWPLACPLSCHHLPSPGDSARAG